MMSQDAGEPGKHKREFGEVKKVFGILGLILLIGAVIAAVVFIVPNLIASGKESDRSFRATSIKAVASSLLLYSDDNEGWLPPRGLWAEKALPYLPSPDALEPSRPGEALALFRGVAATQPSQAEIPSQRPLVFDSTLKGLSPEGGRDALSRHEEAMVTTLEGGLAGQVNSLDWSEPEG